MGSITTTSNGATVVETPRNPGEGVGAWVRRHTADLRSTSIAGLDELETCWPADNPPSNKCCTTTERLPGESDASFKTRHIEDYLAEMIECPPVCEDEEPPPS